MNNLQLYISKSENYNFKNINIFESINFIGERINSNKAVYTVLVTLSYYKLLNPKQDIRYHQKVLEGGFSGRTFDTKYVTPILKRNGFPSMQESGWLTRSLEQASPYDKEYGGAFRNKKIKIRFLEIVDFIQSNPNYSEKILMYLLKWGHLIKKRNHVPLIKIDNAEKITIDNMMSCLTYLFEFDYKVAGGSKLPVICLFSLYQLLCKETNRLSGKTLKDLGSHTASDKTSKSCGDIEIFDKDILFESIEVKLDHEIDHHIVLVAIEKIKRHNPKRYYILSTSKIKQSDKTKINNEVLALRNEHGCELIINGLVQTIRYYLRLLNDIEKFYNQFSENLLSDKELKPIHKNTWNQIIKKKIL